MDTLCIRYTLDPNRIDGFRTCVEEETPIIREVGGRIVGHYLPTDFAGPTNIGYGLIEFANLAGYEQYRKALSDHPGHRRNAAALTQSGTVLNMERAFLHRHGDAHAERWVPTGT